jgi:hypothetical protein
MRNLNPPGVIIAGDSRLSAFPGRIMAVPDKAAKLGLTP